MIFRVLIYVVNTLLKYFLDTPKDEREKAGFRLPAMVPVIFYNGMEKWTAVKSLKEYQNGGELFGNHILNLEYYFVALSEIEEEYILSTNTVLDNIMYCDKFRLRMELAGALRQAYSRVQDLEAQEREEFRNWVKYPQLNESSGYAANGSGMIDADGAMKTQRFFGSLPGTWGTEQNRRMNVR